MIDGQQNGNDGIVKSVIKAKIKKKVLTWLLGVLGSLAPVFLILCVVIIVGSGLFSSFSSLGGLVHGLFGDNGLEDMETYGAMVENMTDEEILELVRSDSIDPSFYEVMMINKDEFQYLLESVIEYNAQEVTKQIQIQCEHKYMEWVEDPAPAVPSYPAGSGTNGGAAEEIAPSGHYEQRTEYVYRPITVSSRDIEKYRLEWQLVYALCLTSTMNGVDDWTRTMGANEDGILEHYGPNHEQIDYVISHVQMNYEYVTDLARSFKSKYTFEECRSLVHTVYEYGDENTEEGKWLYYYPHSVLSRAYSGYSCIYYLISPDGTMLQNMITASDVNHFELIIERFCKKYNFGYFSNILNFIPGGKNLAQRLELYYAHREEGYEIEDLEINYIIGSSIDRTLLPTSTERLDTEFGDLTDYGDLIYDGTIGSSIVAAAMTRLGYIYSQERRWETGYADCSSLVWNAMKDAGIDPSTVFAGSTAAEECRGMVDKGMVIPIDTMQEGDIIFYSSKINGRYRNITHVAIYMGNGKIVHASYSKGKVVVANFYKTGLVCVCRPYVAQ